MVTRGPCEICGKFRKLNRLPHIDAKLRCDSCHKFAQQYYSHPEVKSLRYKKRTIPNMPKREPLPGQMDLFPKEEKNEGESPHG